MLPLPAVPSAAAEDALQPRRKELHRRLSAPVARHSLLCRDDANLQCIGYGILHDIMASCYD